MDQQQRLTNLVTITVMLYIWCICVIEINQCNGQHQKNIDPKSWPFGDPNTFAFVSSSESQPSRKDLPPSKVFHTLDGKVVSVFDDVLSHKTAATLYHWIFLSSTWRFHENTTHSASSLHAIASDYQRGVPWTASYDPSKVSDFEAGQVLLGLVKNISKSQEEFHLYELTGLILRKGDSINLHRDSPTQDGDYTALMFLNNVWMKNDYGEVMFYDNNQDICATVTPKYNRVIIWESSIDYITRPPSMGCLQSQFLLMLRFTQNTQKVHNSLTAYQLSIEEFQEQTEQIFIGALQQEGFEEEIDIAKHVVQKYKSLRGKQIYVLDDLFPQWILGSLRRHTLDYGNYYFDDSLDTGSDNVQWIAAFEIEPFIKTRLWAVIKQVAAYVSGKDEWFPYDIACNLIRSFDHTRIHEDCHEDEDEWTFLLYLNPDWHHNCQGETVFVEDNSDDTEYITSVLPKYGRVVIFQGVIPHSARPPSTTCKQARLSFAVKLSVNEWVAREKTLTQEFDQEEGLHMDILALLQSLQDDDFEQKFQEDLEETTQNLLAVRDDMLARYISDEEKLEEEEEERREEWYDDDDDDNGDADYRDEVAEQVKRYKEFPEVLARKKYIYEKMDAAYPDASALQKQYLEFLEHFDKTKQTYRELIAQLLEKQ